ncbi:MAG: hypothetical protein AB7E60_06610 [Sphingobium sp.]
MELIELLSLIGGLMTMSAPAMQALKTITSRNVEGLSVGSYIMLMVLGSFAVLIGLQYQIVAMTTLNALGWSFNIIILWLISRKALIGYFAGLAAVAGLCWLVAPWFLEGLFTTRWAEPVAFVYGLVASAAFLPQVLMTRKTRQVSALSLPNLLLFNGGMVVWLVVCVMLGNWSLTLWNGILFLMLLELLRLKITVERGDRRSASVEEEPVTPAPIV